MTKGLEQALNLPALEDVLREAGFDPAASGEASGASGNPPDPPSMHAAARSQADQRERAQERLDMVDGRDHGEAMDTVFQESLKHARDLMDLGFNVDIPRARGIFEVASTMYSRAIEAKTSKREAQLKAMKLALEQRKLDILEAKLQAPAPGALPALPGEAIVVQEDRNALIKRLREKLNETPDGAA